MLRLFVLFLSLFLSAAVFAADADEAAEIKKTLKTLVPELEPDSIEPSMVDGLYEVVYGTRVFYISADGRYFLQGNILDTSTKTSITDIRETSLRAELVKTLDESSLIVFSPESPKHTITVFTDIDCGYCRKLHREIESYKEAGIAVRYAAYPRSGPNTPSYFKAVSVWCGEDQKGLMTKAKSGENFEQSKCNNPVDAHMDIAGKIGISGTPTILLEDGTLMPGYVPAARLLQAIESSKAKAS